MLGWKLVATREAFIHSKLLRNTHNSSHLGRKVKDLAGASASSHTHTRAHALTTAANKCLKYQLVNVPLIFLSHLPVCKSVFWVYIYNNNVIVVLK